jgi:hypothetical protein
VDPLQLAEGAMLLGALVVVAVVVWMNAAVEREQQQLRARIAQLEQKMAAWDTGAPKTKP